MERLYIIIGLFATLACSNTPREDSSTDFSPKKGHQVAEGNTFDSSKWAANFIELKNAIVAGDKSALKSFFDFPIRSEGNEIWYIADSRLVMEIDPETVRPFTEADFDRYASSIFSLDLRKSLEILNVEEFLKTDRSVTPEIEIVSGSKTTLEVRFDKTSRKLIFNLLTTGQEFSEFAVVYEFHISPNQQLKFRQVRMAG